MIQKITMLLILAIIAIAGCKQQQQAPWGSGEAGKKSVVMPPPVVPNPQEIQRVESVAKANPNNKDAWIALGNVQMDAQLFADAIVAYQRALELDPKNVDVRVDMGTCYRGVNQPEKAIEEYQKALQINPRHSNAWMNSGVVYAHDLNKPAEAIKAFEKYLEIVPNAPNARQIRAEIERLKTRK
jgi:cytochrome c-type biogenesis protein CcmH/NrfG